MIPGNHFSSLERFPVHQRHPELNLNCTDCHNRMVHGRLHETPPAAAENCISCREKSGMLNPQGVFPAPWKTSGRTKPSPIFHRRIRRSIQNGVVPESVSDSRLSIAVPLSCMTILCGPEKSSHPKSRNKNHRGGGGHLFWIDARRAGGFQPAPPFKTDRIVH